jgi:hypothetical protein
MIRSTNQKLGEYDLIRRPEHVGKVWCAIEKALPEYWGKFAEAQRQADPPGTVAGAFEKAVASYEEDAQKYRQFFDPAAMEEYLDDPNAFKQALTRDVPVIANTLRQRRAELREWQACFRMSRANDLLQVFSNVLEFREDWSEAHPVGTYAELDEPDMFGLDPLDNDETMFIANVIGMGIKSIVLFHLDSARLPRAAGTGCTGSTSSRASSTSACRAGRRSS